MAKLQKSLKQRQRHSLKSFPNAAKLSPAEIRSLNNSQAGSLTNSKTTSPNRSHRGSNATTPPATPIAEPSAYQSQEKRNSTVDLPTPPRSPSKDRHSLLSSAHKSKNRTSSDSASSKPASIASFRTLPTYRGPEITQNGSKTMLRNPSQTIVSNPLSQFSRPRKGTASSSPDRHRRPFRDADAYETQNSLNRSMSLPDVNIVDDRNHMRNASPLRQMESPIRMKEPQTEKFPPFEPEPQMSTNGEQTISTNVEPVKTKTESLDARKDPRRKRMSLSGALFERKKEKPVTKHRRSLSFTRGDDRLDIIPMPSPKTENGSPTGKSIPGEDMNAHPAVRPLSVSIPDDKGKEKEIHSAPVYSRCSCCGRLRRPSGYHSGLSPVLENEHIRTNFNFELERTSGEDVRRFSDVSRSKFTPILPMDLGDRTVQASIEPMPEKKVSFNERGTNFSENKPRPKRLGRLSTRQEITRFGSLHGQLPTGMTRFASLHGLRERSGASNPTSPTSAEATDMEASTNISTTDFATVDRGSPSRASQDTSNEYVDAESRRESFYSVAPATMSREGQEVGSHVPDEHSRMERMPRSESRIPQSDKSAETDSHQSPDVSPLSSDNEEETNLNSTQPANESPPSSRSPSTKVPTSKTTSFLSKLSSLTGNKKKDKVEKKCDNNDFDEQIATSNRSAHHPAESPVGADVNSTNSTLHPDSDSDSTVLTGTEKSLKETETQHSLDQKVDDRSLRPEQDLRQAVVA